MHGSKILKLLSAFDAGDYKPLRTFVASSYFNTNPRLRDLLDFLLSFAPDFNHPDLTAEHAFRHVFPLKPVSQFNKEVIIKLTSKLFALLERYVVQRQLEGDPFTQRLYQFGFYIHQHQLQLAEAHLDQLEKYVLRQEAGHADVFEQRYRLEKEKNRVDVAKNIASGSIDIRKTSEALEQLFIREKLEQVSAMLNHQLISKVIYPETGFPPLDDFFAGQPYIQKPGIAVWYSAVRLLRNPDEPLFSQLKARLQEFDHLLDMEKKRALWACLFNAARAVFRKDDDYFRQLFDLYRLQLGNETLFVRGTISPVLYRNIVTVALRLREVAWVESFVEQASGKIAPEHEDQDNVRQLCQAMIHFEKREFNASLDCINRVNFNDLNGKLSERRLRLKIYFELELESLFLDSINSFRKFLTDHKLQLPDFHLESNRRFINRIYAIYRIPKSDKKRLNSMLASLQQQPFWPEKNWLEGKLLQCIERRPLGKYAGH